MSGAYRIPGKGRLTPAKTVRFTFDGEKLTGLEGDTLASAFLANGIHLTGRSFKYHRPRGIISAGPEEPNALMQISRDAVRTQPNVRATVQELYDGLAAKSQNRWPSLALDFGAVNNLASPLFAAGFYYKTFMWPKFAWKRIYEPNIRAAAGLGHAPTEADPDHLCQPLCALRCARHWRRAGWAGGGAERGGERRRNDFGRAEQRVRRGAVV